MTNTYTIPAPEAPSLNFRPAKCKRRGWLIKPIICQCATVALLLLFSNLASAAPNADLWPYWAASKATPGDRVDHDQWQTLLDLYVQQNRDGINRVSYRKFTKTHKLRLRRYINYLAQLQPTQLSRPEQLAYWINLYNALTVQVVLAHPGKTSIMKMKKRFFSIGPWNDELTTVEGKAITLNDIEHRILRPIWRDLRLHYVLNCASIGCPNLSKKAFTAANAEGQMQHAEETYLSHPRGVSFSNNKLLLSSIFDWYQEDFGDSEVQLKEYISRQLPELSEKIFASEISVDYFYDWALNEQSPEK